MSISNLLANLCWMEINYLSGKVGNCITCLLSERGVEKMKPPRRLIIEGDWKRNETSLNLIFSDIYNRFEVQSQRSSLSPISRITVGDVGIMKNLLSPKEEVGGGGSITPSDLAITQPSPEITPDPTPPTITTERKIFRDIFRGRQK